MSDLILYSPYCPACKHKEAVRAVREFARQNRMNYVVRRTDYTPEYREMARSVAEIDPPFIYNEATGKSLTLKGLTSDGLVWLL